MIGDIVHFYFPAMDMLLQTSDNKVIHDIRSRGNAIEIEWTYRHEMQVKVWKSPINVGATGICKIAELYSDHTLPKSSPEMPTSD